MDSTVSYIWQVRFYLVLFYLIFIKIRTRMQK